jgi:hypothetical protein
MERTKKINNQLFDNQAEFINQHLLEWIELYENNKDRTGYIQVYADKDFKAYGLEYKLHKCPKKLNFSMLDSDAKYASDHLDSTKFLNVEILWEINHTKARYALRYELSLLYSYN